MPDAIEALPSVETVDINQQIIQAMERGEIVLHYQPIVDLISRQPVGCESLCRWSRDGALVPPGTYLPHLDDETLTTLTLYLAGLIVNRMRSCPGWISLNLDSTPLTGSLIQSLAILVPSEMKSRFVLELTEREAFHPSAIQLLNEANFIISIDDWGFGFSNLSALIEYPTHYLKIDKTLTAGVTFSPVHGKVCRFAISLAHEIGAIPIAEGIETQGQLEFLSVNGCTLGQGWHLGVPAPEPCPGTSRCGVQLAGIS